MAQMLGRMQWQNGFGRFGGGDFGPNGFQVTKLLRRTVRIICGCCETTGSLFVPAPHFGLLLRILVANSRKSHPFCPA